MNKIVFLDRDGTINVDKEEPVNFKNWIFTTYKIAEILWVFQSLGLKPVIVTNQSSIGLGKCRYKDVNKLHEWLKTYFKMHNITIHVACCPHTPDDNCECRKPKIGMATQIEKQLGPIDYENSWMIGDRSTDMQFGKNIKSKTILIESQYAKQDPNADFIAKNLWDAHLIVKNN